MSTPGDDFTNKARTEIEHAIAAYKKESEEHEAKAKEFLLLAGIEQGRADGLKEQAAEMQKQLDHLKSH